MNRIENKFKELKKQNKKAFIAYITAGDPSLKVTKDLAIAFDQVGVDIIELGVPFSDPMADGTTIQAASSRALANGTTVKKIFDTVKVIRQQSNIPLVLMTYYNPVYHFGEEKFIKMCQQCGVDGLIIPDLPPEEAHDLRALAKKANIGLVFFVSPTTISERVKSNAQATTAFIYYVAVTGVTGTKQADALGVLKDLKRIKKLTDKPVCVGFGISNAAQVKEIGKVADGVIVGSAIINEIQKNIKNKDLVKNTASFVRHLKG